MINGNSLSIKGFSLIFTNTLKTIINNKDYISKKGCFIMNHLRNFLKRSCYKMYRKYILKVI